MSRIILSKYDNGQHKIVVGWDPPMQSFYGQIFSHDPGDNYPDDWEELLWNTGDDYRAQHKDVASLRQVAPDEVKNLITPNIARLLAEDEQNPNSSRLMLDLS